MVPFARCDLNQFRPGGVCQRWQNRLGVAQLAVAGPVKM